jgi:hypothetical protein
MRKSDTQRGGIKPPTDHVVDAIRRAGGLVDRDVALRSIAPNTGLREARAAVGLALLLGRAVLTDEDELRLGDAA